MTRQEAKAVVTGSKEAINELLEKLEGLLDSASPKSKGEE